MTTPPWSSVVIKTAIKQAAHSAKTVKGKDQQTGVLSLSA